MFGGILDDISSIGDDPLTFFSSATAKALGNAYTTGSTKTAKQKADIKEYSNSINFKASQEADIAPEDSEDFNNIEYQWMKRLQRFSGLNDVAKSSEVKLGSIA